LLEVLEEEELADLRQQQRMFEELRNAEMAEQQRLEEQDRRLTEEKVRGVRHNTSIGNRIFIYPDALLVDFFLETRNRVQQDGACLDPGTPTDQSQVV